MNTVTFKAVLLPSTTIEKTETSLCVPKEHAAAGAAQFRRHSGHRSFQKSSSSQFSRDRDNRYTDSRPPKADLTGTECYAEGTPRAVVIVPSSGMESYCCGERGEGGALACQPAAGGVGSCCGQRSGAPPVGIAEDRHVDERGGLRETLKKAKEKAARVGWHTAVGAPAGGIDAA